MSLGSDGLEPLVESIREVPHVQSCHIRTSNKGIIPGLIALSKQCACNMPALARTIPTEDPICNQPQYPTTTTQHKPAHSAESGIECWQAGGLVVAWSELARPRHIPSSLHVRHLLDAPVPLGHYFLRAIGQSPNREVVLAKQARVLLLSNLPVQFSVSTRRYEERVAG